MTDLYESPEFQDFMENADKVWTSYMQANPLFFAISGMQLTLLAIEVLRTAIEDPNVPDVTWDYPFVEFWWPVSLDEHGDLRFFDVTAADFEDERATAEALIRFLDSAKTAVFLRGLTRDVVLFKRGNKCIPGFPDDVASELKLLRGKAVTERIRKLTDQQLFSFGFRIARAGKGGVEGAPLSRFWTHFSPLAVDEKRKEAYFRLAAELDLKGPNPARWSEQSKAKFWETLSTGITKVIPVETFSFLEKLLPVLGKERVTISVDVKTGHVEKFIRAMPAFVELQADYLNETGKFTTVIGPPGMPTWVAPKSLKARQDLDLSVLTEAMGKSNSFRRYGEYWTIRYEEEMIRLKDTKGLNYIAQLLGHPERDFHVFDLIAAYERHEADFLSKSCEEMSQEELGDQQGLTKSVPGSAGAVIDAKAAAAYRAQLGDLYEDLKEATEFTDVGRRDAVQMEIDRIEDLLETGYGRYGKSRAVHDPVERARKSVTNRIDDSLKKIKAKHPSLWKHLRKAINKGTIFSYYPDKPTIWET